MRRQEADGFTLIELVMVIVILGILAAVAVPRYLNLTAESQTATVNAGVSAAGSGIAIAAARNRTTFASPTVSMVLAELPGSACAASGGIAFLVQGKVNVPLSGTTSSTGGTGAMAVLVDCATGAGNTIVQAVGTGVYSV